MEHYYFYEDPTYPEEYVELTQIYYDDEEMEEEHDIPDDSTLNDSGQGDEDSEDYDSAEDSQIQADYDPTHQDFIRTVLMIKICNDLEHEVHWQLADLEAASASIPQLMDVYSTDDGQSQALKNQVHAPYCRCCRCPFHDEKLIQNLRHRRQSPFTYFYFNPQDSYVSSMMADNDGTNQHLWFCQCNFQCGNKSTLKLIAQMQKSAQEALLRSELTLEELVQMALFSSDFDAQKWRNAFTSWTIEAIEKRRLKKLTKLAAFN